jgi:hypothetical protein
VNRAALLFSLFLLLSGESAFGRADDRFVRAGLTLFGTGFLSATVEYGRGDTSVRLRAGIFEPTELCIAATVHRYFDAGGVRPQAGIGFWNVLIFPEGKFGRLTFLTIPIGIEREMGSGNAVGLEGDINCFLNGRMPGGGPVSWNKRGNGFRGRLLPLPAVYYSHRVK